MARQSLTTLNREVLAAAREARLRYVSDRLPGIQRKKKGKVYRYIMANGRPVSRGEAKRITALVIPPAWKSVWICPHSNGHIQATGRDAKGRKQYRYHTQWQAVRSQTKFENLLAFARALPKIRRRVKRDLRLKGLPREKVLAAAVTLMEHTHIRVGNVEYAEENQSFGLSTLRDRHVLVQGDRLQLNFRGKSGKFHRISLDNARLARIVKRCQDLPGYELFQYLDEKGECRVVSSDDINDYLKEITGADFTAKDFRTWAGSVLAMERLHQHDGDENEDPTESGIVEVCSEVAAELGNTRAVCRAHYIHPAICEAYLRGELAKYFDDASSAAIPGLKPEENAVVRLLKKSH